MAQGRRIKVKKQFVKAVLSSVLLLLFLFLAVSGAMLYFGKTGMVMGVARHTLRQIHAVVALLMCLLIVVHFILNIRTYIGGLKALFKNRNNK